MLGTQFLDDTFFSLKHQPDGSAAVEITDPAAHYGLRVVALSPAIKAIQVYAPLGKNFVAVEPQFNLVDPYSKVWEAETPGWCICSRGNLSPGGHGWSCFSHDPGFACDSGFALD